MKRREFITLLGGAVATWPLAAYAQQAERMQRIGWLTSLPSDAEEMARLAAFREELQKLGWAEGRNIQIDVREAAGDIERIRKYAGELVALAPDVILANGISTAGALRQATRTVPIVFVQVTDAVGGGLVESLARPGGNATGFTLFEYSTSAKWLELLKQIAPSINRTAVLRDSVSTSGIGQFAAIQSVSQPLGVELRSVGVGNAEEIERGVTAFARGGSGGLIVTVGAFAFIHRELIIKLAAQHRLPAVYAFRNLVTAGGLMSYGSDSIDAYRRAAGYVDRILRGEKPADLPVQAPTKFELVINLKTAKTLGLDMPATLLARADEVIE
jgi:putative ABC transport system substrate-binding protein